MPLGQYGYEHEPIEEPEPERETSRFSVQKIGLWLLGLCALGVVASVALQFIGPMFAPSDIYNRPQRAALDKWLARHDADLPWLTILRPHIVGERVVFLERRAQYRVYRVRGISMQECVQLLEAPLAKDGITRRDPVDFQEAGIVPENPGYKPVFMAKYGIEIVGVEHCDGSNDLFVEMSMMDEEMSTPAKVEHELGFDPFKDVDVINWNKMGPPAH